MERSGSSPTLRGKLAEVLVDLLPRMVTMIQIVNRKTIHGRQAKPLQRVLMLLHHSVVAVFESEPKTAPAPDQPLVE